MARPATPPAKKAKLGNPGKRKLPAVPDSGPALSATPPDGLDDVGAQTWSAVVTHASWLTAADAPVLRLLCESADRRARFLGRLAQFGDDAEVQTTETGYMYLHPLVGLIASLETRMTKWLSVLGLTPTDRARLGLTEAKKASKLEEIRGQQRKRSAST